MLAPKHRLVAMAMEELEYRPGYAVENPLTR